MPPKHLPIPYELDVSRGIAKSDGPDDHARLLQAIAALSAMQAPPAATPPPAPADDPTALKLDELLEKFLLLKAVKQATAISYKNTTDELTKFLKNPPITRITSSDITRYQEHLAERGNVARTVDSKVGTIRALYNFAIKQGYTRGDNPAANRALLTKKQRAAGGYATFETDEIALLLSSDFFRERLAMKSDYTTAVLLALLTGCRVGEITTLQKEHFKRSKKGVQYITIRDSKTAAGVRDVPLHPFICAQLAPQLDALKSPSEKIYIK
jgi:site-specific recombinase XerD